MARIIRKVRTEEEEEEIGELQPVEYRPGNSRDNDEPRLTTIMKQRRKRKSATWGIEVNSQVDIDNFNS